MGIECKSCALNGVWSGQFRHDANDREDAAFSAWLTITDGRVTGSTLEPNTFVQGELAELELVEAGSTGSYSATYTVPDGAVAPTLSVHRLVATITGFVVQMDSNIMRTIRCSRLM